MTSSTSTSSRTRRPTTARVSTSSRRRSQERSCSPRTMVPESDLPASGMPGMPDMPDLGGIFDSLQKVQEARSQVYEGHAGGGAVVVRATGDLEFESVTIDPEVVDPSDVEMLQDLVLAALHDLATTMATAQHAAMGALGSLDLGGLLGGGAIDTTSEEG